MTDKLKELALAAKAEDADQSWYSPDDLLTGVIDREADAAFIAAASPDAILALIAELDSALAEVERLKAQEPVGYVMHVLECSTLFLEKPDPNAIPLFLASGAAQKVEQQTFEDWWNQEGQFVRAGGGDYEKCFAYAAWNSQHAAQKETDRG